MNYLIYGQLHLQNTYRNETSGIREVSFKCHLSSEELAPIKSPKNGAGMLLFLDPGQQGVQQNVLVHSHYDK